MGKTDKTDRAPSGRGSRKTATVDVTLELHAFGTWRDAKGRTRHSFSESYAFRNADGERRNACYGLPLTDLGFKSRNGARFRVTVEQLPAKATRNAPKAPPDSPPADPLEKL